jgi:hypothetical protein
MVDPVQNNRILDLFNYPRLLHNAFQCATISGNIIWADFTCVAKVAVGSTNGSTLHFAVNAGS